MTDFIELSEDAFAGLFKPIANHINPNASYDWGDGYGTLFETYDEEFAFVRTREPSKIWTLVSGDDGEYVISGFHFVNRLGYFITETAVPGGIDIHVAMEGVDSVAKPSISCVTECLQRVTDYLWKDERRDYLGTGPCIRKMHIFRSLLVLRKWLDNSNREIF